METAHGRLYESDAIAHYVASHGNANLLGKNAYENALVQQYVSFAGFELSSNVGKWYYPIVGWGPYNKANEEKAKEDLKRALVALNTELVTKTFLVGERATLADITVFTSLFFGYQKLFDPSYRADFPNVTRWFVTCANQPHFLSVTGSAVVLCEKAEVYDAKKFNKEEPKKEKKPAAAPAPKDTVAAIEDEIDPYHDHDTP